MKLCITFNDSLTFRKVKTAIFVTKIKTLVFSCLLQKSGVGKDRQQSGNFHRFFPGKHFKLSRLRRMLIHQDFLIVFLLSDLYATEL